jgi:hypothetical protein
MSTEVNPMMHAFFLDCYRQITTSRRGKKSNTTADTKRKGSNDGGEFVPNVITLCGGRVHVVLSDIANQ